MILELPHVPSFVFIRGSIKKINSEFCRRTPSVLNFQLSAEFVRTLDLAGEALPYT